jgi:hypothetical protein
MNLETQQKKPLGASAGTGKAPTKAAEKDLTQEEVVEKASAIPSEEIVSGQSDPAVEQLTQV